MMVTPLKETPRSNRGPVCAAVTGQHFSGLKKHFLALECVFFFPLPGPFPNRGGIEFTCKEVLVH